MLLRQYAGQLRDAPLCGYMSVTRVGKATAFTRLLEVEGVGFNAGQPWPLHVHVIACVLQRFFFAWPQASLWRYTIKRPDWLAPVSLS